MGCISGNKPFDFGADLDFGIFIVIFTTSGFLGQLLYEFCGISCFGGGLLFIQVLLVFYLRFFLLHFCIFHTHTLTSSVYAFVL